MPSGTFRRAQCLQAVTILNTIALKKKKNPLPKKAKSLSFLTFLRSLKNASSPTVGNDDVASCGKLRQASLSRTHRQPLLVALDPVLAGCPSSAEKVMLESSQAPLCLLADRVPAATVDGIVRLTKLRGKLAIGDATWIHTMTAGIFLAPPKTNGLPPEPATTMKH